MPSVKPDILQVQSFSPSFVNPTSASFTEVQSLSPSPKSAAVACHIHQSPADATNSRLRSGPARIQLGQPSTVKVAANLVCLVSYNNKQLHSNSSPEPYAAEPSSSEVDDAFPELDTVESSSY